MRLPLYLKQQIRLPFYGIIKNFITRYRAAAILLLSLIIAPSLYAADYYWVGGSGNWSDINHWATTSGGTVKRAVVPGPTDDVYFDANSGFTAGNSTVRINITANCHNLTVNGATVPPKINQSGPQILNIYGSLELQTGMPKLNVQNIYFRHSNEHKTIRSNGVEIGDQTIYLEEKQSISLLDNLTISIYYDFYHNAGTLNTNNHDVTITARHVYFTQGSEPRTLNLGSSKLYLNVLYFHTQSSYLTLNAGTSHIYMNRPVDSYLVTSGGKQFYNITFNSRKGTIEAIGSTLANPAYFNRVEIINNGIIRNYNTFDTLIFSANKTYGLDGTQTILSEFSFNTPDCAGFGSLTPRVPGAQATISAGAAATIDVKGAVIQDITATGGAVFTALNSVDGGNNTGWNFTPPTPKNLYWIGGAGNWNDPTHWSLTSGGITDNCVPCPADNVFFDSGSGFTAGNSTVTIDNNAHCHNLTVNGAAVAPEIKEIDPNTTQYSLNIYGSLELQTGMPKLSVWNISFRNSNEHKTIRSNGVEIGYNYVYLEEKQSISLLDNLKIINKYFSHIAGTFNTNNHDLTIGDNAGGTYAFFTYGSEPRTLNLGSSKVYVHVSAFNTNNNNLLTVNAGTSHIYMNNPSYQSFLTSGGKQFYDITFTGNPGHARIEPYYNTLTNPVYFNRVEFKDKGILRGFNTINTLIFSANKTYSLQSGTTQTVQSLFSFNTPDCAGFGSLTSETQGTQAVISAGAGATIDVNGAFIQDIAATGGATFTALNSVDGGNNTGWNITPPTPKNLYWVGGAGNWNDINHWSFTSGGAGGDCVPVPTDNVFFDSGSGFTNDSKTVTIDNNAHCHNLTVNGAAVAPEIKETAPATTQYNLNIYGSLELQTGMPKLSVFYIYFRNSNENKTIRSNGVEIGRQYVYLEEKQSISLLDNLTITCETPYNTFHLKAGTLNTNNHDLTISAHSIKFTSAGMGPRTLNLGSSNIYCAATQEFRADSPDLTVNAGTSHIYTYNSFYCYSGQQFNNLTFTRAGDITSIGSSLANPVYFNKVVFKGNGTLKGYNTFNTLEFSAGKTYSLESGVTQTINNWIMGGTPCEVTQIQSTTAGTRANVNITGSNTTFDFANIKDINASGAALHFGSKSTDNGNNNNITFDPYNAGEIQALGPDWNEHIIDNSDPATYLISTNLFYGNEHTLYKWYRLNDPAYLPTTVISTAKDLDIRPYKSGTFKVEVTYTDGVSTSCAVTDEINVRFKNFWVGGTAGAANAWNTGTNWTDETPPQPLGNVEFANNQPGSNGKVALADLYVPAGDPKTIGNLINETTNFATVIPATASLTINGQVVGSGTAAQAHKLVVGAEINKANGTLIVTTGSTQPPIYGTVQLYAKGYKEAAEAEWTDNIDGSPTFGQKFKSQSHWQYFGVPVKSIVANPTFYGAYLRMYDETLNSGTSFYYKWHLLHNESVLEAFKGYSITQPTATTYSIAGKLLMCDTTVTMTRRASAVSGASGNTPNVHYGLGQNLFGNSYTAAINITDFAATLPDNVEKTIYLYNTGRFHDWATTGTLTTGTSPQLSAGNWFAVPTASAGAVWNNEIPSMQGFMLKFTDDQLIPNGADQIINIPYASRQNTKPQLVGQRTGQRVSQPADGTTDFQARPADDGTTDLKSVEQAQLARPADLKSAEKGTTDFKSVEKESAPLSYLRINLESASTRDALWLISQEGTTNRFDDGWDGRKYFGTPTAYIFTENKDGLMQVNADETIDGSLISFYANADTEYELTLIKSDLEQYDNLHLHDLVTKTSTALDTDTTYYRFTADNHGKVQKRFVMLNNSELKLKDGSICLLDAYLKNNELLVISNLSGKEGQVSLYDTTGRLLFTQNMPTGIIEIPVNLSKGIYLVNLQAGGSRETVKIAVK